MLFTLEALDAKQGDALILHYGTLKKPRFIVIDGGPKDVYRLSLSVRLEKLRKQRKLQQLRAELLMISHIDDDHIHGILDLTASMIDEQDRGIAPSFKADTLWHNSFGDIVGREAGIASVLPARGGRPSSATQMVVATVPQGRALRKDARALAWPLNEPFSSVVSVPKSGGEEIEVSGGLSLTVLGPRKERLDALKKTWAKYLVAHPPVDKVARVSKKIETSVYNLSSIIVLAEFGPIPKKRMLLTGDATSKDIIGGLKSATTLLDNGPARFDIVKMPHHGSIRNVDADFFAKVVGDNYVFSANGKDDNPDLDTLKLLTAARGTDRYTMHFTNRSGENGLERKLTEFFAKDRAKTTRRYSVNFRTASKVSLKIDLGDERITL